MRALGCWIALLGSATVLHAFVLGGGLADKDCRVAFGGVDATDGVNGVVCTDGDPACDRDGAAEGSCRFDVSICTGVAVAGCTPESISSIAVVGLPVGLPPLPSTADTCGAPSEVVVPVGAAAGVTAIARTGGALKDVDYLNLCCRSVATPLDAARCAVGVDPGIAGCTVHVPAAIGAALARARNLIEHADGHPTRARADARKAARALGKMRRIARHLSERDVCGDALSLIASQALASVAAAIGQLPPVGLGKEAVFATRPAP